MEEELQQKQNFLRMNILERGYDAEQFMGFLQGKKGDLGLDLNNWSLNELILAVQEFTLQNNLNNVNNNEQLKQNNNNLIQMDMENSPNQNQFQQINSSEDEYIQCENVVFNELSQAKDAEIKLSFPEKVEGGLFSKSYVTYLMQTSPLDYKIRKRYSDFEWLRNAISTIYINCVIPPLCKKNYADRFSEVLISKRTRSIEKFMNGLLIHPLIKNSEIFFNFISIENEAEFEKKKKSFKIVSPNKLESVKSLTGQLKVTVNKEKEIYFENIKDNSDFNINLLKKLTTGYKGLIELLEQINGKMKEISDIWNELYKKSMKYYENKSTYETYNIMSKVMDDWREINKKQKILINEGIREYFRYVKNEFNSIKDLAIKVDNNRLIFMKAFEKLTSLKENVYKQDISNWGLNSFDMELKSQLLTNKNLAFSKMLPNETKKVDELRHNYGFYLNSLISEFERIRELNGKRHKNHVINFIKNITETLNDFSTTLVDRVSIYDEIKEKEEKIGEEKNNQQEISDLNNNINEGKDIS